MIQVKSFQMKEKLGAVLYKEIMVIRFRGLERFYNYIIRKIALKGNI